MPAPYGGPVQVPAAQVSEVPSEMAEDLTMSDMPVEADEEEVDENSAAYRGNVSVADSLEFVSEERRALIEPALPRAASHLRPPAAPRSMRENQKDPRACEGP